MKSSGRLIANALILLLSACGNSTQSTEEEIDDLYNQSNEQTDNENAFVPISLSASDKSVSAASVDFGWRIFGEFNQLEGGNVLLSPMSASLALSILANGAAGMTREEVVNALGFDAIDIDAVNGYNKKIVGEMMHLDTETAISSANALWYVGDYAFAPEFISNISQCYDASVRQSTRASLVSDMNQWCSEKTYGMLEDLFSESNTCFDVAVANALYFRGKWRYPFEEADTRTSEFRNLNGTVSSVAVMNMSNAKFITYYGTEAFEMISIPYGNGAFSMQVILPREFGAFDDIINSISNIGWANVLSSASKAVVNLKLPRFAIESEIELNKVLSTFGIKSMFDGDADFSNMCASDIYFSMIKQWGKIVVDETGAEAAAVTVAGALSLSAGDGDGGVIDFYATEPFVYAITEQSTGTILFVGKIVTL